MTTATNAATTQVHKVYIRATAQAIWDAITSPEWTVKYGYGGYAHWDLRVGGALTINPDEAMIEGSKAMGWPIADVIIEGEVLEVDAPHHLRATWRMNMDPSMQAEGFSTIAYDITEYEGFCSLVVTHELEGMPNLSLMVAGANADPAQGGGGHPWILSDLKSVLETGKRMSEAA
ncbi:MAG: SRPBCC domain-containing protein [Acidimicrobiales bacterium]